MAKSNEHISAYGEIRPLYEKFTEKIKSLLLDLFEKKDLEYYLIEHRTKSVESFKGKISPIKKSYRDPLQETKDFSGIRIILQSLDDIEKVESVICREFIVDQNKSTNKSDNLDPDRFGYLSNHYVIKVKEPRISLSEWSDFKNLWAEIQVRTVLQHGWALISHAYDYKTKDPSPREIRRRLFRVSALLETADSELNLFIKDFNNHQQELKERIASGERQIEINIDSLKAYIESAEIVEEWVKFIESLGIKVGTIGNALARDVDMLRMTHINSLDDVESFLKEAKTWGRKYLEEFFHNTWGKPLPPDEGITIDRNGIVELFLIASFPDIFTSNKLNELGYGLPARAIDPARKYNPKYNRS